MRDRGVGSTWRRTTQSSCRPIRPVPGTFSSPCGELRPYTRAKMCLSPSTIARPEERRWSGRLGYEHNSPMLDLWNNYFVMVGGAAAALVGLIFVALSINPGAIIRNATHRNRAINMLTGFTAVFMACGVALIGNQSIGALGIEWLILWLIATAVFIRGYVRAIAERYEFNRPKCAPPRGQHPQLRRRSSWVNFPHPWARFWALYYPRSPPSFLLLPHFGRVATHRRNSRRPNEAVIEPPFGRQGVERRVGLGLEVSDTFDGTASYNLIRELPTLRCHSTVIPLAAHYTTRDRLGYDRECNTVFRWNPKPIRFVSP